MINNDTEKEIGRVRREAQRARERERERERKRGRKREGKAGGERPLEFYVQPLQQRQRGEGGEDWGRGGEFH